MERRTTKFADVRFSVPTIKAGIDAMRTAALENPQSTTYLGSDGEPVEVDLSGELKFRTGRVLQGSTERTYSDVDLFLGAIRGGAFQMATLTIGMNDMVHPSEQSEMTVTVREFESVVVIDHNNRAGIDRVFGVFEDSPEALKAESERDKAPLVFIGHGGKSQEWRDVSDYLRGHANLQTVEFGANPRTGLNVVDVVRTMLAESSIAVVVMSGEDQQQDGSFRARENVIHEIGLFQAKLGNARTILLKENGVEPFSNIEGVQYIPYDKGRIRETFGDIVAAINREFPPTAHR
jgi:predicted nucleotide-binding protein